jgi:hypothetical protein
MPSLAHEGNPKEDEIIITAGSVLSTAQLDIDFLFFGGAPNVPSWAATPFKVSSSCPNVFTWPDGREYIPFNYNDVQAGGAITVFTDQLQEQLQNTTHWLDLDIESKPNCCGCAYVPFHMVDIPTMSFTTDQVFPVHDLQSWRVSFQAVQDTPYAGICAWVEDGSTFDDFTGYVLAANYELSVTKFMKYVHQSLCNEGTILGIIEAVPIAANDTLTISVFTDPNAASVGNTIWELIAEVKDSAGAQRGTPLNIQTHDSLMDVVYTNTGRGTVFTEERTVHPPEFRLINGEWVQINAGGIGKRPDTPTITPSDVTLGHRHNRANVGFVALGNHPLGQDTNTFVGGQNAIYFGGTMTFGASTNFYGLRANLDSYSFGTGTLS